MKIKLTTSLLSSVLLSLLASSAVGQEKAVEKLLKDNEVITDASGASTTTDLAGQRDLSKYVQGGDFHFGHSTVYSSERGSQFTRLVQFLCDSLAAERLAYARMTYNGRDAGGTYHYFVEPDRDGRWVVITRMVRWHALSKGERLVDFPKAYRLQKIEHDSKILELKFFEKSNQEIEQLNLR